MSVEIREIIAKRVRAEREIAALHQWALDGQKDPLTPELKVRWLSMVAEHDGVAAAALTMDKLATQPMPEVIQ